MDVSANIAASNTATVYAPRSVVDAVAAALAPFGSGGSNSGDSGTSGAGDSFAASVAMGVPGFVPPIFGGN